MPVHSNAQANAQAGATSPIGEHKESTQPAAPSGQQTSSAQMPTADDVCHTLEQAAAENALPVEFFARVIWQESRFNATAVSAKGAGGIAQFMPRTADWHGLTRPSPCKRVARKQIARLKRKFRPIRNRLSGQSRIFETDDRESEANCYARHCEE